MYQHSKLVVINRPLTLTQTLPITDFLTARYLVPNRFMGFFTSDENPETILSRILERSETQIIDAVCQEERYLLREERKRPWSWKTRRPFRGKMDKERHTFSEKLELAERIAIEITVEFGPPWEEAKTGRPPIYDSIKLSATLLVKSDRSFNELASELRNIHYDATIENIKRTPCPSELHYAFTKISPDWLEKALARLDERSTDMLKKFDAFLDLFVIDGSSLTGERLGEKIIAMKRKLVRRIYPYTALLRLPTNTVRGIAEHTNKIAPFVPLLNPGSRLLADPEYDVEENYREARERGIDLQVKQREGEVRKPFRKKARRVFSYRKYGKRKLGERYFANVEVRGHRCYYRKEEHKYKGALLIGCEHNILAYFKNKRWSELFDFFIPHDWPPS